MGKTFDRRSFLTGSKQTLTDTIPSSFAGELYSNRTIPTSLNRTDSGITPYTGVWTEKEVLHLLRRTTFGAKKAHVDLLKTMTMSQAVDYLIDNPVQPSTTPVNSYQQVYNDTQNCPAGASWVDFAAPFNDDFGLTYFRTYWSHMPWWYSEMINQPPHILEKMTLFWANHFSTQAQDINYAKGVFGHFKTLRQNALGNFRTMIKQVTVDPHMLLFLNGAWSNKWAPDENYARELQELFTVGKGPNSTYTENDVKEASKVLTGWRWKGDNPDGSYSSYFDSDWHDDTNKQFSAFYNNKIITGKTGAAGATETDELITMILDTQEAAKYIVRRLYRWFVYYIIDASTETNVIEPLATVFRNSNYNISTLLKALFKSEHFFDPLNVGCIIKSPVDLYVAMNREFNVQLATSPVEVKYSVWRHFYERTTDVGQSPGDPPNVAGWWAYYQEPVFYQAWISSATIQKRAQALNEYIDGGYYHEGFKIKIDCIAYAKLFTNIGNPTELVQNFITYLLPKDLSDNQKTYMKSILLSNQTSDFYWTNAWNAYVANPNAANTSIVQSRLETLINYITSLEEYQLY
jgi:Protein of unknown function (DUF1800)